MAIITPRIRGIILIIALMMFLHLWVNKMHAYDLWLKKSETS